MADDRSDSATLQDESQGGARRRVGCWPHVGLLAMVVLALFYWNFLRVPRLRIATDTTYITKPLTSDGASVDYFAALEQEFDPPQMKTDDNGYRLIVRALGDVANHEPYFRRENDVAYDAQATATAVYEKLGLDPADKPTVPFAAPLLALPDHASRDGRAGQPPSELEQRLARPWKLDDLPQMKPWLQENGPILDLVAQAVGKPAFYMPLLRKDPAMPLSQSLLGAGHIHRARSFASSLAARANFRLGTGNLDGASDDTVALARLGRHFQRQVTMVEQLVGIVIEGMADKIGIAAIRQQPPTPKQLRRFLAELGSVPPRLDMDKAWLVERYLTLDWLQPIAQGRQSFAERLPELFTNEAFSPGIARNLTLDWNSLMRQVNVRYDDPRPIVTSIPPSWPAPGDLSIGIRSRHVGDCIFGLLCAPRQAWEEARRRTDCSNNLRRIALAMLLYEREHGSLPPAWTVDAQGNPLHSWRVLLLPYLGEEKLFAQIRLNEPWDSKHNRRLHDAPVAVYRCPTAVLAADQTTYSVIVGKQAPFQPGQGRRLDELGMNLVLVVERVKPVCWMDPDSELTETVAKEGIRDLSAERDGMGGPHPGGVLSAMRDGSSRFLTSTLEPAIVQSLLDGTAKTPPP